MKTTIMCTKMITLICLSISGNYDNNNDSRKYLGYRHLRILVANVITCHVLFVPIVISIGYEESDMSLSR